MIQLSKIFYIFYTKSTLPSNILTQTLVAPYHKERGIMPSKNSLCTKIVLNMRNPLRSNQPFTMKPFQSLFSSRIHTGWLMQRVIHGKVIFFYSDDLNSHNTYESIHSLFSTHTSETFHPYDAEWIKAHSFTYMPHSNECGPRTLLALLTIAIHPTPNADILLPLMHDNLAQICRWWGTKIMLLQHSKWQPIQKKIVHIQSNAVPRMPPPYLFALSSRGTPLPLLRYPPRNKDDQHSTLHFIPRKLP